MSDDPKPLSARDALVARLESSGYDAAQERERVAKAAQEIANGVSWWRGSLSRYAGYEVDRWARDCWYERDGSPVRYAH